MSTLFVLVCILVISVDAVLQLIAAPSDSLFWAVYSHVCLRLLQYMLIDC